MEQFKISEEEAQNLLFQSYDDEEEGSSEIFDRYGNYVYPFDIKVKQPNTVIGFSAIGSLIQTIQE